MKMFKGYLFIFLVIHIRNPSCAIKDVYDTGEELWKMYSMINDMNFTTFSVSYREIRNQMCEIHEKFNRMEKFMNLPTIRYSFTSFDIMLYKSLDTLEIFIQSINECYEQVYQFVNGSSFYPHPMPNSAQTILNVEEKIQTIRKIMGSSGEPSNAQSLLPTITSFVTTHQTQLCNIPHPVSSALVQLFKMVTIAEMKVSIILAYARIQQIDGPVEWTNLKAREQFEMYFVTYVNLFAFAMRTVDDVYLRACEPDYGIWIRNENFYELEGTFQTTIFRYNWKKCEFDGCNDIWFEKQHECEVGYYDDRSGCSGTSAECAYLEAIQGCVLKTGPYKFQYVNSTAIGSLGRNFQCPEDNGYIIENGSGWDFTTGTCACNCYRNHNKISLMIVESRESVNMVIIGLRFTREDGILYLQPREGKLGAHGYIHPYSERWIPIRKHIRTFQIHSIDKEHKVFFLDDVHLDPGFVLTGVKFDKVIRGTVAGFAIKIFGVPFDYESGQLKLSAVLAISKQTSNANSGQPVSFQARSSLYTTLPLTPSPSIKQYISLKRSELSYDFGQSTLPFFDAVSITTRPPSPLGGVGIFHKSSAGYAGFISLRVYGIKYSHYFRDPASCPNRKGFFYQLQCN